MHLFWPFSVFWVHLATSLGLGDTTRSFFAIPSHRFFKFTQSIHFTLHSSSLCLSQNDLFFHNPQLSIPNIHIHNTPPKSINLRWLLAYRRNNGCRFHIFLPLLPSFSIPLTFHSYPTPSKNSTNSPVSFISQIASQMSVAKQTNRIKALHKSNHPTRESSTAL